MADQNRDNTRNDENEEMQDRDEEYADEYDQEYADEYGDKEYDEGDYEEDDGDYSLEEGEIREEDPHYGARYTPNFRTRDGPGTIVHGIPNPNRVPYVDVLSPEFNRRNLRHALSMLRTRVYPVIPLHLEAPSEGRTTESERTVMRAIPPYAPRTILQFYLLSEEQLDALAADYHQRDPNDPDRNLYPHPMDWDEQFLVPDRRLPPAALALYPPTKDRVDYKQRLLTAFYGRLPSVVSDAENAERARFRIAMMEWRLAEMERWREQETRKDYRFHRRPR